MEHIIKIIHQYQSTILQVCTLQNAAITKVAENVKIEPNSFKASKFQTNLTPLF